MVGGLIACVALSAGERASAQELSKSSSQSVLDVAGMAAELERLDGICERLNLTAEQRLMRDWLTSEGTDSHVLYLPVEADPLSSRDNPRSGELKSAHDNWLKHFTLARQRHARYWVAQAERAASEGDEWTAYRHLWRAIREDAMNPEAKRALSPLLLAMNIRSKPRSSPAPNPQLGWPAGSFTRLDTANFQLISRANAATTLAIAQQLENFHALWTQVFFPLWARPNATKERLAGRGANWSPRREFRVVICGSRQEYLQALGIAEANIEVSVGYYNAGAQLTFFYPSEQLNVTLYHELTHQLLAEGSLLRAARDVKYERDFWLVEGIALYMESLAEHKHHWRVGGWMSPRLQSARYRALHDGYWVEWDPFTAGGQEQWKEDPEISKLYTQAAGLTHFFLDKRLPPSEDSSESQDETSSTGDAASVDPEAARVALYAALASVYRSEKPPDKLRELLGGADAQRAYVQFLLVRDSHLQSALQSQIDFDLITELVLSRSQLSAEAWQGVGRFKKLAWLDLSFSNATGKDLVWLEQLTALERLNLEGTAIDASALKSVANLAALKELDLSGCAVDDSALQALAAARSLETLWLSGTKITAASTAMLEALPKLSFVALDGTQIPATAASQLNQRIANRQR